MLCALLLYLQHEQRRLSERSTAMWQLNLKMQERIARLELVKTDLHRQIRHNEIIYPKKYDHVVFAGEEIEHTRMWLDVLLHSPAFRDLDPFLPMTLATIVLSVVWSLLVGQGPLEALIDRLSSFGGPPGSSGGNAQRRQHILEP